MEIGLRSKNWTLLTAAALAVVLLGLALSYLTWQNLERQRQTVEEHLFLSSQVILRGIEAGMAREMRGHMRGFPGMRGMHGFNKRGEKRESVLPRLKEMFSDLIENSDVEFVSFYSQKGELIFSARAGDGGEIPALPTSAWRDMDAMGEWAALYDKGHGEMLFVSAVRTKPSLARLCEEDEDINCTPDGIGIPYLVVGINPAKHLTNFQKFRRTALLHTAYVLLMAVFLWTLGAAYLRRRDQSRALHRLETFHSRLLDTMPDGLLTLGADGVIRAANPAAQDLLREGGELVGRKWDDLHLERGEMLETGGDHCPPGMGWEQFLAGGRSLEVMTMRIPAHASEEGEAGERLVLVRDRTDLKALEDDLAEARQQAAIGRLAAGLAHEIRNPLSALRGFAQFFTKKLAGKQPEEQYARTMVNEADRLDKVITDLMFLSRPRAPEKIDIDTAALADDLRGLLEFELEHHDAEFAAVLDAPVVHADPDMLKQALLNLLLNSLAAVGTNEEGQPRRVELRAFSEDGRGCLSVRDTGPGMTDEERERALEPFFTSKREGTGLGLAIVHRIMRNHGGRVGIDSRREGPDHGAEVRLCFPPAESGDACEPENGEES